MKNSYKDVLEHPIIDIMEQEDIYDNREIEVQQPKRKLFSVWMFISIFFITLSTILGYLYFAQPAEKLPKARDYSNLNVINLQADSEKFIFKGVVLNESYEPIQNAKVSINGGNDITDENGEFSLNPFFIKSTAIVQIETKDYMPYKFSFSVKPGQTIDHKIVLQL